MALVGMLPKGCTLESMLRVVALNVKLFELCLSKVVEPCLELSRLAGILGDFYFSSVNDYLNWLYYALDES